jgi:hypothetical protein
MANALYGKGKEKLLAPLMTGNVKAVLVSTAYTPNMGADEFFPAISTFVIGTPVTLTNKSIAGGVFSSDNADFGILPAGSTAKGVALYIDSGVPGTSPLYLFEDTITGFPFATNGGQVIVQLANGPYAIFAL